MPFANHPYQCWVCIWLASLTTHRSGTPRSDCTVDPPIDTCGQVSFLFHCASNGTGVYLSANNSLESENFSFYPVLCRQHSCRGLSRLQDRLYDDDIKIACFILLAHHLYPSVIYSSKIDSMTGVNPSHNLVLQGPTRTIQPRISQTPISKNPGQTKPRHSNITASNNPHVLYFLLVWQREWPSRLLDAPPSGPSKNQEPSSGLSLICRSYVFAAA